MSEAPAAGRRLLERRPLMLGYHAVSERWPTHLAVTVSELAAVLGALRRRGFAGYTFAEAELRRRARALPRRSLVVTFDDGFASVMAAREALAWAGFPATVFVVTRFVERGELLDWPGVGQWRSSHPEELKPLSWEDLHALIADGWEIGSHTVTHPQLRLVDDDRLGAELAESRTTIQEAFGACQTLAYPYGVTDARVAAAARRAGYLAACTLVHSHRMDDPFRRPRVAIVRGDNSLRLALKLSSAYLWVRRSPLADAIDRARFSRGVLPSR
jgi:peptidoglycan/xylan/chitin deacetylase (PgdA/CDA1 family)